MLWLAENFNRLKLDYNGNIDLHMKSLFAKTDNSIFIKFSKIMFFIMLSYFYCVLLC